MINLRRPDLLKTKEQKQKYIDEVEKSRPLNKNGNMLVIQLPETYCKMKGLTSATKVDISGMEIVK